MAVTLILDDFAAIESVLRGHFARQKHFKSFSAIEVIAEGTAFAITDTHKLYLGF
jgi:hypothetical protein